jgi:hypothetical protein
MSRTGFVGIRLPHRQFANRVVTAVMHDMGVTILLAAAVCAAAAQAAHLGPAAMGRIKPFWVMSKNPGADH